MLRRSARTIRAIFPSALGSRSARVGALLLLACGPSPLCGCELDTLVFGSLDAGSTTFVTTGVKVALGALDRDGFVGLASLGAGRRPERGSAGPRTRYSTGSAAVIGYQWLSDWGAVSIYGGPEGLAEFVIERPVPAAVPPRFGLRLQGELWARLTADTLLQATAIAGTARDSLWSRLSWGYRLWGAYLGPEAVLATDATDYRKWCLGLHATDFDLGPYSFRLSVGLQHETGQRGVAPYVALAVWSPW